jgi:predicted phage terminase large subunit-like protein
MQSLSATRQAIGEFSFSRQYQQNPVPLGGAIVKVAWLKYYEPGEQPAKFSAVIQSWDTANKSGELNDYSVCTTWGVIEKKYFLLDVCRKRLDYPDLKREVKRLRYLHRPNKILIEDKASGTQLIQELKAEGIYEATSYAPPPGTDKIMRLNAQIAPFENGSVLLPRNAPWLADYIAELTGFPGSRHADQFASRAVYTRRDEWTVKQNELFSWLTHSLSDFSMLIARTARAA